VKTAMKRTHAIVLIASLALLGLTTARRGFASPAETQAPY